MDAAAVVTGAHATAATFADTVAAGTVATALVTVPVATVAPAG